MEACATSDSPNVIRMPAQLSLGGPDSAAAMGLARPILAGSRPSLTIMAIARSFEVVLGY